MTPKLENEHVGIVPSLSETDEPQGNRSNLVESTRFVRDFPEPKEKRIVRQHGHKGVYYGGDWLDIEECAGNFLPPPGSSSSDTYSRCVSCPEKKKGCCPRSKTRNDASLNAGNACSTSGSGQSEYDVVIIGAGCIGSAIARELSRYSLSVLVVEAADDVSQGATKGNSGIVHAGYDDKPGTNRAKYCWSGNQMFSTLDKQLRFGYQKNGSLVVAFNEQDMQHLEELKKRGETNGVERLRIVDKEELLKLEPAIHPNAIGALHSPDAGNVIPYEYAIALAENAVDNGVEIRIRREVQEIKISGGRNGSSRFEIRARHWEPKSYADFLSKKASIDEEELKKEYITAPHASGHDDCPVDENYWDWPAEQEETPSKSGRVPNISRSFEWVLATVALAMLLQRWFTTLSVFEGSVLAIDISSAYSEHDIFFGLATCALLVYVYPWVCVLLGLTATEKSPNTKDKQKGSSDNYSPTPYIPKTPLEDLVSRSTPPIGSSMDSKVSVGDMLIGGSGSSNAVNGVTVGYETVTARYVVNCAGGASDKIARMIGDSSFTIKPRLGDYILLNRNQGHLTQATLFPCPDPVLGKGVLVQATLWGNLILGPTARDMHKVEARDMSDGEIQEYILSKCKLLVPYFDATQTIHGFAGARAKSDRGDWIIEPSAKDDGFIHVAGIDSPGLAGSPAIALEVVNMLRNAGLDTPVRETFNPNRAPIITPKDGLRGLKMGPVGKNDSDGTPADEARMSSNVICKCERVTELEVVRALRRSLPIDSTQAIRKRTRAGMGHCQGSVENYNCECRVKAIIARESGVPVEVVGGRPWPATSTLGKRWLDDEEKDRLQERMMS